MIEPAKNPYTLLYIIKDQKSSHRYQIGVVNPITAKEIRSKRIGDKAETLLARIPKTIRPAPFDIPKVETIYNACCYTKCQNTQAIQGNRNAHEEY